ncbi:MAG TPA: hypothetical protein VMF11_04085 [Candidatus Baltobacteraceae bacterium]|nr:hypothetical protein [Candidatus Baltobacteraceae bacterium]
MKVFPKALFLVFLCTGVALAGKTLYPPETIAVNVSNHTRNSAWITLYGKTEGSSYKISRAACVDSGSGQVFVAHYTNTGLFNAAFAKVRAEVMEGMGCKGKIIADLSVESGKQIVTEKNATTRLTTTLIGGNGMNYTLTRL